jgi:PhzF family phenazine biosynthesis protein
MKWRFFEIDVFGESPYLGNPLAVVGDAYGLTTREMRAVAAWTNLSETTFLLPPTDPAADYRVRIFTPTEELPFAGHPTLGSCHAWLGMSGSARDPVVTVQECAAGLIRIRRTQDGLAFAAPPLVRSGPVEAFAVRRIASQLRLNTTQIVDSQWVANGPEWVAVLLSSAAEVLALRPGLVDMDIGVVGPCPAESAYAFEVRAFFPQHGATVEDPVTGSLNASLAEWLIRTGRAQPPYVCHQGTALGRSGRVAISSDAEGCIWVGGETLTCVEGFIDI